MQLVYTLSVLLKGGKNQQIFFPFPYFEGMMKKNKSGLKETKTWLSFDRKMLDNHQKLYKLATQMRIRPMEI